MAALPIVLVGQADLVLASTAFFEKFGCAVEARFGATQADADRLGVAPFSACEPAALKGHAVVLASDDLAFQDQFLKVLLAAGCSRRHLILHRGLHSQEMATLLEALTPDGATGPNPFVQHLLEHYPQSGINPLRVLAGLVSARIQAGLAPGRKTLAVYYPDAAYRANLGSEAMYARIREKGYNVVFLFGTKCGDAYEQRQGAHLVGQAYQPLGILTYLTGLDVLIVPTAMEGLPGGVQVVLALHDIFDSPVERDTVPALMPSPDGTHAVVSVAMTKADSYDYLLVPSTAVMEAQGHSPMTRRNRVAIPAGYLKLDHNLEQLRSSTRKVDSIVYATTVMKNEFGKYVSLPDYGEPIVAALLEHCPDHNIIFRPHPHTRHFRCVSDLVARFSSHSRFIFDADPTEYMDAYARSALMVSDMSGTAFTFAFTTLRPVVFFSHNEADGIEAAFHEVAYFRHRSSIGTVATTLEELVDQVRQALAAPKGRAIEAFRAGMMYNLGNAENAFVQSIDCIMAGEMMPTWRALPSLKYCGGLEDPTHQGDTPKLVEQSFRGYNLVLYRARFYALALSLGPVHLQEMEPADQAKLEAKGLCVVGATLPELKQRVAAVLAS